MSNVVIPYRFRCKRDTAANWTANNPVLLDGEWGKETDTGRVKIGDGSTAWNSLLYTPISLPTKNIYARKSGTTGPGEACTLTELLDFVGTTAAGDVLYRDGTGWKRLAKSSDGYVLTLVSGLPAWAAGGGGGGGGGDPFVGNTASLLHFDGTDGATTFTDVRGKTWTASGDAQLDTAQFKWGSASLLLDGTGDYISATHADLDFTADNKFTMEAWIRPAAFGDRGIFFNGDLSTNPSRVQVALNSSGQVVCFIQGSTGSGTSCTSTSSLTLNTWQHIAFTRDGSKLRVFINGTLEGTASSTDSLVARTGFAIGNARAGGAQIPFNGHIDDVRLTKGVCRYSVNFTAPTGAFTDA